MSLQTEFTSLADGFRKRFDVSSRLTIADMIKLVTPPAFKPVMLLYNEHPFFNQHSYGIQIPDHSDADIKIVVTATVKCSGPMTWNFCLTGGSGVQSNTATSKTMNTDGDVTLSLVIPRSDLKNYSSLYFYNNPLNGGIIVKIKAFVEEVGDIVKDFSSRILIPQGKLYFTQSDSRDTISQGGWGIILPNEIQNADQYLDMANNGAIVRLHLYIKDNQQGSAAVKWGVSSNTTNFQVNPGMCTVDFPQATNISVFRLAIHAIDCGISADLSKSYLELVAK